MDTTISSLLFSYLRPLFTYLQRFYLRWWRREELQFGVYFVWILLLILTNFTVPGTSFLLIYLAALVTLLAHAASLWQASKKKQRLHQFAMSFLDFWRRSLTRNRFIRALILLFNIARHAHDGRAHGPHFTPIRTRDAGAARNRRTIASLGTTTLFKICIVLAALATADYHKQFPEPTQLIYVAGARGEKPAGEPQREL